MREGGTDGGKKESGQKVRGEERWKVRRERECMKVREEGKGEETRLYCYDVEVQLVQHTLSGCRVGKLSQNCAAHTG